MRRVLFQLCALALLFWLLVACEVEEAPPVAVVPTATVASTATPLPTAIDLQIIFLNRSDDFSRLGPEPLNSSLQSQNIFLNIYTSSPTATPSSTVMPSPTITPTLTPSATATPTVTPDPSVCGALY
jgi:hypothetical protein